MHGNETLAPAVLFSLGGVGKMSGQSPKTKNNDNNHGSIIFLIPVLGVEGDGNIVLQPCVFYLFDLWVAVSFR